MTRKTDRPVPFEQIFSRFLTGRRFRSARRIGSGHINETYKILTDDRSASFVLQRINSTIFQDIPGLMRNIEIVTHHLETRIAGGDPHAGFFLPLRLIPADNGDRFVRDPDGESWRLYNFIEGSRSYDMVESHELAMEGGRAFGLFQYLTSDIPPENLTETIPYFHDLEKRMMRFHDALQSDLLKRARSVKTEIGFVRKRESGMMHIPDLLHQGKIPFRITHNDTKFNNILFSSANRAVCIVDLDTVMPGTVLYDFGDAIRTGASKAAEDEKNLSKVDVDLGLFAAYAQGYLSEAGRFLLPEEISGLVFSVRYMTFIIGLRFLTDHLDGDRYYRISFPGHNLQRARAQFRLLERMEKKRGNMEEIIASAMRQQA